MNTDYPKDEIEKTRKKGKLLHETRQTHTDAEGRPNGELHIFEERDGGFRVWINTGVADFDGICIGTGLTYDQAIADAVEVVEWMESMLQGPPPARYTRETPAGIEEAATPIGPWRRRV